MPLELINPSAPFCDGFKIYQYKELFKKKEEMRLFLKQFLNIKSLKSADVNKHGDGKYYWVRLNDDNAFINK